MRRRNAATEFFNSLLELVAAHNRAYKPPALRCNIAPSAAPAAMQLKGADDGRQKTRPQSR